MTDRYTQTELNQFKEDYHYYNQTEIYQFIRSWEMEVGEDFWDCNETIIDTRELLFFLYGKGHLTTLKFQKLLNLNIMSYKEIFFNHSQYSVFNYDGFIKYENEFVVVTWMLSDLLKALPKYYQELKESFKEHDVEFKVNEKHIERFNNELKSVSNIIGDVIKDD